MLVGIEVNSVDSTRSRYRARVEKAAMQFSCNLAIRFPESHTSLFGAGEFRRDCSSRCLNRRRRHNENIRRRHAGFDRCLTDRANQCRDPLSRVPGIMLVHRLEVVRPQHHNDHRQWRIHLNALLNAETSVATWLERILPDSSPTIQAVLDDPHVMARSKKFGLDYTWPPRHEWKPLPGIGNDPPGQGIGVDQDLIHGERDKSGDGYTADSAIPPGGTHGEPRPTATRYHGQLARLA